MGFFDELDKLKRGVIAQINPFDRGATFDTVRRGVTPGDRGIVKDLKEQPVRRATPQSVQQDFQVDDKNTQQAIADRINRENKAREERLRIEIENRNPFETFTSGIRDRFDANTPEDRLKRLQQGRTEVTNKTLSDGIANVTKRIGEQAPSVLLPGPVGLLVGKAQGDNERKKEQAQEKAVAEDERARRNIEIFEKDIRDSLMQDSMINPQNRADNTRSIQQLENYLRPGGDSTVDTGSVIRQLQRDSQINPENQRRNALDIQTLLEGNKPSQALRSRLEDFRLRGIEENLAAIPIGMASVNPIRSIGQAGQGFEELTRQTPLSGIGSFVGRNTKGISEFGDTGNLSSTTPAMMAGGVLSSLANYGRFPTTTLLGVGGNTIDETVDSLKSQGYSHNEALIRAVPNAVIQASLERAGGRLGLDSIGKTALRRVAVNTFGEMGEEATQQITDNLFNNVPWYEGVAENAAAGALGGLGFGGLLEVSGRDGIIGSGRRPTDVVQEQSAEQTRQLQEALRVLDRDQSGSINNQPTPEEVEAARRIVNDSQLQHTMPDGTIMRGPEHEGAIQGSTVNPQGGAIGPTRTDAEVALGLNAGESLGARDVVAKTTDTIGSFLRGVSGEQEGVGGGRITNLLYNDIYGGLIDRTGYKEEQSGLMNEVLNEINKQIVGEDKGMSNRQKRKIGKDAGRALETIPNQELLNSPAPMLAAKYGFDVQTIAAAQAGRRYLDRQWENRNAARRARGEKEIAYKEDYLSHFATTFSESTQGENSTPTKAPQRTDKRRTGETSNYEKNMFKVLDRYTQEAANDIYLTPVIQVMNGLSEQLRAEGLNESAKGVERFIRQSIARTELGGADQAAGLNRGAVATKIVNALVQARSLSALALNVKWMLFTQPLSLANTAGKSGAINTVKGALQYMTSPELRAEAKRQTVAQLKAGSNIGTTLGGQTDWQSNDILKSRTQWFNELIAVPSNFMETTLNGISALAAKERGEKLGLKGQDLENFMSFGIEVTQSVYNPETRPLILQNALVRALFPFQTYSLEMWRNAKNILTGQAAGYKVGGMERIKQATVLIAALALANWWRDKTIGEGKTTPGSFVPFVGSFVDRGIDYATQNTPLPDTKFTYREPSLTAAEGDADRFIKAINAWVRYGDIDKFRKEAVFWGMGLGGLGGASTVNRLIDTALLFGRESVQAGPNEVQVEPTPGNLIRTFTAGTSTIPEVKKSFESGDGNVPSIEATTLDEFSKAVNRENEEFRQTYLTDEENKILNFSKEKQEQAVRQGLITQEQLDQIKDKERVLKTAKGEYDEEFAPGVSEQSQETINRYNRLTDEGKEKWLEGKNDKSADNAVREVNQMLPEGIEFEGNNKLGLAYAELDKELMEANDPIEKSQAQSRFWKKAVYSQFDSSFEELYEHGGTALQNELAGMSKEMVDRFVTLDNLMVLTGARANGKLSNKWRRENGYGSYPGSSSGGSGRSAKYKSTVGASLDVLKGLESTGGLQPSINDFKLKRSI